MEYLLESSGPLSFLKPYAEMYRKYCSLTWEDTLFHPVSPNHKYIHVAPVVAITLYILMLIFLPKVVPKGGVGKLKGIMFLWNAFLCLLSVGMFVGPLVPYLNYLMTHGVWETVCSSDYGVFYAHPTLLFWSYVFAWSKYAELLDTFFIIIRGGKPQLLHTWHHISVLAFTWYASYYKLSVGYIFAIVNAFIHTLMYYYYAVASIGYRPSWAFYLTMAQITQMFVGIACIGVWVYGTYFSDAEPCACTNPTIISSACFIMYASYAYLFIEFAVKRYCNPRAKKAATKKSQ